jgi:[ribosomal protein S5]-alanine N-acetyltransferase
MTLAPGTDRLESARLVLRRVTADDLPFFTRIHALPEVAQYLYPDGRPRTPDETASWLQGTLASYEHLGIGHLAVVRKEDGALIGRCGLTDLAVEAAVAVDRMRRGWFGRAQAPAGIELTFECELGYTFDPRAWGHGFATEAVGCVRDYVRDTLCLTYAISTILPQNIRSRRVAERLGVRSVGQLEVLGLTWDRYLWPLASGGEIRLQPYSAKPAEPEQRQRRMSA